MGCLIQVNVGSFLDKRERKLAFAILKHGFVHCLGTDAHDLEHRNPDFMAAKLAVEKAGCQAAWENAEKIMHSILNNEEVIPEMGKPIKKLFGCYR
jgi:tyrosine-protein phosphatase YwqE